MTDYVTYTEADAAAWEREMAEIEDFWESEPDYDWDDIDNDEEHDRGN